MGPWPPRCSVAVPVLGVAVCFPSVPEDWTACPACPREHPLFIACVFRGPPCSQLSVLPPVSQSRIVDSVKSPVWVFTEVRGHWPCVGQVGGAQRPHLCVCGALCVAPSRSLGAGCLHLGLSPVAEDGFLKCWVWCPSSLDRRQRRCWAPVAAWTGPLIWARVDHRFPGLSLWLPGHRGQR